MTKTNHALTWRGIKLRITHMPSYIAPAWDHLDIRVLAPKGAILPITGTSYRSHFLCDDNLAAAGGAVAFVRAPLVFFDRDRWSFSPECAVLRSRRSIAYPIRNLFRPLVRL